jgi:hypothetical protein
MFLHSLLHICSNKLKKNKHLLLYTFICIICLLVYNCTSNVQQSSSCHYKKKSQDCLPGNSQLWHPPHGKGFYFICLFIAAWAILQLSGGCHHYLWHGCKSGPMLGAQGLWAGRDLYRATSTATFIWSHLKDRHLRPRVGFEPPTQGSSDHCSRHSNHCATRATSWKVRMKIATLVFIITLTVFWMKETKLHNEFQHLNRRIQSSAIELSPV